jgi:tetratricopeptide (TPR) repeat protein
MNRCKKLGKIGENYDELISFCQRILENPHGLTIQQESSLLQYLGELYQGIGKDELAAEAFRKAETCINSKEVVREDVVSAFLRGRLLAAAGRVEHAEKCYLTVLNGEFCHPMLMVGACRHLADIYETSGDEEAAAEMRSNIATYLETMPNDTLSVYKWGSYLERNGHLNTAADCFEKVLGARDVPDRMIAGAYYHLGNIALMKGKPDDAEKYFISCLKTEPGHKRAKMNLFESLHYTRFSHSGKNDIAEVMLSDMEIMFEKKEYTSAIRKLESLITLIPDHLGAYMRLEKLYRAAGEGKRADDIQQKLKSSDFAEKLYLKT